ncbi:response regulator transcription factor [Rhodococcus tukisamuensis]|uniref:DNA-binding response regulator, OmpR family, contains REC and winged-helix (WHTH) domain n=1 Tax=Rhodococcus tukisamuensis TaxID=168276 RepID=A0A1G7B4X4_9NOCA|nr:response regulator transcription factor [Rhodococcus tukisamuensis]SDE22002.1 DNA-binding response regulator, OmpR family, contains REC and winged-helix (wHTH) domain [Rhodococcus tukisamuensis]
MASILLIEDDPAVAEAMRLGLSRLGHHVRHLADGNTDLSAAIAETDLILLDLGLPGADGYEICRRVRAMSAVPIVILTARSDDVDTVAGLEAGADDYVVKPVTPRVLDARIKAVLRRTAVAAPAPSSAAEPPAPAPAAASGAGLDIDRRSLRVRRDGVLIALTPTEIRLLLVLSENPGQVLSRRQLLASAWDQDYLGDSRLVDAAIQRLRAKVEDDPSEPRIVETVRGFGYRFVPSP